MNVNASIMVIITSGLLNVTAKRLSEIVRLRAVTDFGVLEEYYYSLYTTKTQTPPPEPSNHLERAEIKKTICRKIFTSSYFEMGDVEWIDVEDPIIFKELFDRHQYAFENIFKRQGNSDATLSFEYENAYRLQPFLYDLRPESDYMFFCPVRKKRTRKIKMYLVSQAYDVNLVHGSPIAGRFVFKYDRAHLVVQALAEESAVQSALKKKARFAEYLYIKRRQTETQNLWPISDDPVCALSWSNKLRLCSTLFASKMLKKKYVFRPSVQYVEFDCVSRRVSFVKRKRVRTLVTLRLIHFDENRIYEENMIGCKAKRIDNDEMVTYYVSRGDVSNTIFAYKKKFSDDRIFVAGYFWNVSVVGGTHGSPTTWQGDDEDWISDTEEEYGEGGIIRDEESPIGAELRRSRGA